MSEDKDKRIKELEREVERLEQLVYTDELTEVFNRRGLYDVFGRVFERALKSKKRAGEERRTLYMNNVAVLFVDADDFKKINDTYGHDVGDVVLREISKTLYKNTRGIDGVARIGGEEFVVILMGADENAAYKRAESLLNMIRDIKIDKHPDIRLTASVGVVSLSDSDADDFDELVGYADKAMYKAKTSGKNKIVRYSELGDEKS